MRINKVNIHDGTPRVEIMGAVTKSSIHVALEKLIQNGRAQDFSTWDADQLEKYASRIRTLLDEAKK